MKVSALLTTVLLAASAASHAALYTITWNGTTQLPTDTELFTSALTPYLAVSGPNFYHVHQSLSVGSNTIFIPLAWAPDQWLSLDGTNSISFGGWLSQHYGEPDAWRTVEVTPGLPALLSPAPEPGTLGLVALGVSALVVARRRRK